MDTNIRGAHARTIGQGFTELLLQPFTEANHVDKKSALLEYCRVVEAAQRFGCLSNKRFDCECRTQRAENAMQEAKRHFKWVEE